MEENQIQAELRKWAISQGLTPAYFNTPEGQAALQRQIKFMTTGGRMAPEGLAAGNKIFLPSPVEVKSDAGVQLQADPATGRYKTEPTPYTVSSVQTGLNTPPSSLDSYPTLQGVVIADKDGQKFELSPDGNLQPYVPPGGGYSIQAPKERGVGQVLTDLATKIPLEVARGVLAAKDTLFGPPQNAWIDLPNDPRGTQDPRNQRPYFPTATPGENALYAKFGVVPIGHEEAKPLYGYKPWIPENTNVAQSMKYGGIMGAAGTGLFSRGFDSGSINPINYVPGMVRDAASVADLLTGLDLTSKVPIPQTDFSAGSSIRQPVYGANGLNQPLRSTAMEVSPSDGFFTAAGKSAVNNVVGLADFLTSPMAAGTFGLGAAAGEANAIAGSRAAGTMANGVPVSHFSALNDVNRGISAAASPNVIRGINAANAGLQADFAYGLGSHAIQSGKNVWDNTFGGGEQIQQPVYEPYSAEWYQQLGQHMQATGDTNLQNPYTTLNSKSLGNAGGSLVDAILSGMFAKQIAGHTIEGVRNPAAWDNLNHQTLGDYTQRTSWDAAKHLLAQEKPTPSERQIQLAQSTADDTFLGQGRIPENASVIRVKPDNSGLVQRLNPSSYLEGVDPAELVGKTDEQIQAIASRRLNEIETEPLSPDSLDTQIQRQKAQDEFRQFQEKMNLGDIVLDPRMNLAAAGGPVRGVGRDIKPKRIPKDKETATDQAGKPVAGGQDTKNAATEQVRSGSQIEVTQPISAQEAAPVVDHDALIKSLQERLMGLAMDTTVSAQEINAVREELKAAVVARNNAATPKPAPKPATPAEATPPPAAVAAPEVKPAAPASAATAAPAAPAAPATQSLADVAAEALPKPKQPKTKPKTPAADTAAAAEPAAPAPASAPTPKDAGPKKQVFFDEAVMPEQTDADKAIYGRDMPRSFPIPEGNEGKNFKFMVYDRKTKAQQWIEADNPMNFNQAREKAIEQYGESAVVIPMRRIVPEGFQVTDRKVRSESPYQTKPKVPKPPRIPEDQRAPQIPPREAPKRDAAALLEQVKDPRRLSYDELVELSNQGNQVAKDELASRQRQVTGDKADRRAARTDGLKPTVETADQLLKRIKDTPAEIEKLQAEATEINKHAIKLGIRSNTPEGKKQMDDRKNFPNGRTLADVRRDIERKKRAWSEAKAELNQRTRMQQGWVDVRGKQTLKSNAPDLKRADQTGVNEEGAPKPVTPAGHRQGDMPRISGPHALRQHKGDISRLTNDQLAEVKKDLEGRGHTDKDKSDEGKTLRKINNALDRRALSAKVDETLMSREDLEMRRDSIPDELAAKRRELALNVDKLSGPEKSKIIEKIKDLEAEKSRVDSELGYRKRKEAARRSTYGGGNPGGKEGTVPVPDKAPKKGPDAPDAEAKDAIPTPPDVDVEAKRQAEESRRQAEEQAAAEETRRQEEQAAAEQAAAEEETRRQEEETRRREEEDSREEFRSSVEEHTEAIENLDNLTQAVQKQVFGTKKNPGVVQKLREANEAWENAKTPAERRAAMDKIEEQLSELEAIRDEMQEKSDNTPESLQETEAFLNREEAISALDDAISGLRDTLDIHEAAGRDLSSEAGGAEGPKSITKNDRAVLDAHRKMREIQMKLADAQEAVEEAVKRDSEERTEESSKAVADAAAIRNDLDKQFRQAKRDFQSFASNADFDVNAPRAVTKEQRRLLDAHRELQEAKMAEANADSGNYQETDAAAERVRNAEYEFEMAKREATLVRRKPRGSSPKVKDWVDAESIVTDIQNSFDRRGVVPISNGLRDVLGKYYDKTGKKLDVRIETPSSGTSFNVSLFESGTDRLVASAEFSVGQGGDVYVARLDTSTTFRRNGFATGLIAEGLRATGTELVKSGFKKQRKASLHDASDGGASGKALENVVGRTKTEETYSEEVSPLVEGAFEPTKAYSKSNPGWATKKSSAKDYFAFESQFESLPDGVREVVKDVMKGGANVERVLQNIVAKVNSDGTSLDASMARYAKFLLKNADVRSLGKVFRAESLLSAAKGDLGESSHYMPASLRSGMKEGMVEMSLSQLRDPVNALPVIMHEITHATTHAKINRALFGKSVSSSLNGGSQGVMYLDKIRALVKDPNSDAGVRSIARSYLKYLDSADAKRPVTTTKVEEAAKRGEDIIGDSANSDIVENALINSDVSQPSQYGAINLHEFAAEVMTDRNFQYELSKIKLGEKSDAMALFRKGVKEILGMNADTADSTLLGRAMESVLEISKTEHEAIRAPGSTYYNILREQLIQRKTEDGTFAGMSPEEIAKAADEMMTTQRHGGSDFYDIESDQSVVGRTLADIDADIAQLKRDQLSSDLQVWPKKLSKAEYDKRLKTLEYERQTVEKFYEDQFRKDKKLEKEANGNLRDMGVKDRSFDQVSEEMRRIKERRETDDYEPRNLERDKKAFEDGRSEEEIMRDLGEGYGTQERKMDELRNEAEVERLAQEQQTQAYEDQSQPYEDWSEMSELGDENYDLESRKRFEPNSPKSVKRLAREEVRAHVNAVEDFKQFVKTIDNGQDSRPTLRKWGNRATDIATVSFLQASQGELLKVAERYNSKATLQISALINGNLAGRADGLAKDLGFHGEVSTNSVRFNNKLADTVRAFETELRSMSTTQQRALLEALGSDVTRAGLPKDPKMAKAVSQIRELYKELFYYQKRAGVEIDWAGDTYMPRMLDNTKVFADPNGFVSAASDAYVMSGMPRFEADKAAMEWYQNIVMGDSGFSFSEGSFIFDSGNMNGQPKHTRSRKFGQFADKVLEKYYNRNILDVTQNYIAKAVRNAELSRRFGNDFGKYQALQKRIIFGEKNEGILREVNENVAAQLGAYGGGGALRQASNVVNSYTAISMLPRATFSSLTEPVVMAIRSGRMTDVFKAYKDSAIQFGRQLAELPPDYQTKLAEDIGVVAAHAVSSFTTSSVTNRYFGDGVNNAAGKITSKFFRRTGLHQFTEGTRVAAVAMGETFIRRLARDIREDNKIKASSTRYLRELGVTDVDAFANFVESLQTMDEAQRLKAITGNRSGKVQREYRNALVKFAEQTIMNPNAGTRPRWAAHPIGAMCYNLQSYLGAFHENVTKRVMRTTIEAGDLTNGLTFHDRIRMLGPLATFPVLFFAAYGLNNNVREELFTDPARRFDEPDSLGMKQLRAMSRSNMLGRYDALVNLATNAKYDKDPATALLGPGLGILSEGIKGTKDYFSDQNSPNTNTAERRAHRLLWDIAIRPPMNALMSVGGVGRITGPLAAAGIQASSHPALRERYVEEMAGPPVDPKNRPPKKNFLDDLYNGQ